MQAIERPAASENGRFEGLDKQSARSFREQASAEDRADLNPRYPGDAADLRHPGTNERIAHRHETIEAFMLVAKPPNTFFTDY